MSTYARFQKQISGYYNMLKEQYSVKYLKEALLGIGILFALFAGYFLHHYYVQNREERAFGALDAIVDSFEKAQYTALGADATKDKDKVENAWKDTEILLDSLYKEHIGSYLAPYFLMYKSQIILEKDNDVDAARAILEQALQQLSKGSQMYALFDLKRIAMAMDAKEESVRAAALQDLKDIAKDSSNYMFEQASYMLGLYYIHDKNQKGAREVWESLTKEVGEKDLLKSPWAVQAEEKLKSL